MCKYCTEDIENSKDLLWCKAPLFKNVDAYFQSMIRGNKLKFSLAGVNDISVECTLGVAKIKYCPMCGRKLDEIKKD